MALVEGYGNPFRLPPDDQIFLIREQERQRKAAHREKAKTMHVWEKTTACSRVSRNRRTQDPADELVLPPADGPHSARGRPRSPSFGSREVRREKENIAEFVAKKREMFLVQMSLDVKKAEILKLDERARQKEEALKKSQQMLKEDVTRFDQFLQNNDQKAHDAMKNAEEMTKQKQDRLQKIKQVKSQLSALQSEIAKHREQKDECLKYKSFLEKLTPQEWKDQTAQAKLDRKRRRKQAKVNKRMTENASKMQAEIEAEERAMEEKAAEAGKARRRQRREVEEEQRERERELEARKRRIKKKYPTREAVEAEVSDDSSGDEMPLYFQEPKQLLDVFVSLEESNLFLIQNSQDTEQALEELEQKFADTMKNSVAARDKVHQAIHTLERQIEDERAKSEELKTKLASKHGASEQEELLRDLTEKTEEVYNSCGHEAEHDPNSLMMLASIEAKLEEYLTAFDEAEAAGLGGLLEGLERKYETARRTLVKRQRKDAADHKIEKRLNESLQRSQAPIHKKTGKQIMFRSAPLFQARRVVQEDDGYEEAVKEHEVFGIWMGRDGVPNAVHPVRAA